MSFVLDLQSVRVDAANEVEAMGPSTVSPIFCLSSTSVIAC
ncbi:SapB/AmfS family lanthipeptide [Nocardiopsis sp. FIRDI 009]|nr:SapB/AmfS family lanthipeptide [Nocardiopsis sp. FIRDI 009]